jgi:hypothetical protein
MEAPMEGSVLGFLKAEWKVSDTGSVHWSSSFDYFIIESGQCSNFLNSKHCIHLIYIIYKQTLFVHYKI